MRYGQVFPEDHALCRPTRDRWGSAISRPSAFGGRISLASTGKESSAGPGRGIYTLRDASVTERHSCRGGEPCGLSQKLAAETERVRRLNIRESRGISSAAHSIL